MGCLTSPQLVATPLHARLDCAADIELIVVRVPTNLDEPPSSNRALVIGAADGPLQPGYGAYLTFEENLSRPPVYVVPPELSYLEDGDIIRLNPRRSHVWVMYRRHSR